MTNNTSSAEFEIKTRSQSSQIIEWILAGIMYPVLSYVTIACSIYQFYSNQRGLRLSNRLCTVASLLLLLSMIPMTLEVTLSDLDDHICTWITDFMELGLSGSLYCVYMSLWCRQNSLYRQVRSNDAWVKRARIASKIVIAVLTFSFLALISGNVLTGATYIPGELCVKNMSMIHLGMAFTLGAILSKVGLTVLDILPLTKYFSHVTGIDEATRRCARCSVVCLIADIVKTTAILFAVPAIMDYDWLTHGVLALSLCAMFTANVVALIFSFADCGKRLFPFKSDRHEGPATNNVNQCLSSGV